MVRSDWFQNLFRTLLRCTWEVGPVVSNSSTLIEKCIQHKFQSFESFKASFHGASATFSPEFSAENVLTVARRPPEIFSGFLITGSPNWRPKILTFFKICVNIPVLATRTAALYGMVTWPGHLTNSEFIHCSECKFSETCHLRPLLGSHLASKPLFKVICYENT